ncbi:hypothetical protein ACLB2K_004595 [Fragaria x ananassa]
MHFSTMADLMNKVGSYQILLNEFDETTNSSRTNVSYIPIRRHCSFSVFLKKSNGDFPKSQCLQEPKFLKLINNGCNGHISHEFPTFNHQRDPPILKAKQFSRNPDPSSSPATGRPPSPPSTPSLVQTTPSMTSMTSPDPPQSPIQSPLQLHRRRRQRDTLSWLAIAVVTAVELLVFIILQLAISHNFLIFDWCV